MVCGLIFFFFKAALQGGIPRANFGVFPSRGTSFLVSLAWASGADQAAAEEDAGTVMGSCSFHRE